jgi:hypothetical protein
VIRRDAIAALALVIALAMPAGASAQSISDNDFSIDLAQGLAAGSGRQVGMGNAFTAIAAGLDGVAFNPASAAMRSLSELKRMELRGGGGISFPGRFGTGDFFNNGLGSTRGVNIDDSVVLEGGMGLQIGMAGLVGTGEVQSYIVRGRDGASDSNVNLQSFRVGGGFGVLGGDVVLGASLLVTRMTITSGLGIGIDPLVQTSAPGMEIGAVYRPEGGRFRVGMAAVSHIKATVAPAGASTVVSEGGYILPNEVVRPWEARFGFAYQLGPRPLNRRYELPPDAAPWIRAQDRRARCERIERQLEWESQRDIAPRSQVSLEERSMCPTIDRRPSDADFWEEERIRREEERNTRAARIERERKRIKHQRWIDYEMLPRRYFLISADLVVIGGVKRAVGIDGFLDQELRLHGERPSFLPRIGVEGEPWERRLKLRSGAYVEPGRNVGVAPRVHFTAGFDVRLFALDFTGPVNPWDFRVGATMDVARDYSDLGVSIGFWY